MSEASTSSGSLSTIDNFLSLDTLPSVSSLADSTNCNCVTVQRCSSTRKNSAERSIIHTRMEDADIHKEYEYGESLGEGSFGKVYRAKHLQTGDTVAIKEIVKERAGSSGLRQLEKEVSIFKKVDHKNIIKLKEVIESPKKMYLIMELCEGGDLAKLLQKQSHLTESDTKIVMSGLAAAIKYLHQQGILHRDLKLENILLAKEPDQDGSVIIKVSDFGLSTQQLNNSYENMQEQYCGTLSYMAPEMNSTYSYPVDVWAMGIIMYHLLTRYPKDNELNESVAKGGPQFEEPQWENVSDQAKDLLREMLTVNPAYRLSSGEVLNHEWFTGKKREHGNVLELMKDFGREQKEGGSGTPLSDGQEENALEKQEVDESCLSPTSVVKVSLGQKYHMKELGKKAFSTDMTHRTTSSPGNVKTSKLKSSSTKPVHTPAARTLAPKSGKDVAGKSSTVPSSATSNSSKIQSSSGTNNRSSSRISTPSKIKRK